MYRIYCRVIQFMMRMVSYLLPWRKPELIEGESCLEKLAPLLIERGWKHPLIVTGPHIYASGLLSPLEHSFVEKGINYEVYSSTVSNPTVSNVEEALSLYWVKECDGIIVFGGGSPMDCGKAVASRIARPNKKISQMRGVLKVRRKIPYLVAIPTTAGTGSETTIAAVISDPSKREKYAISDVALIPHVAVLDPIVTRNLPPFITATTGMDALTHAIEAYIGRSNTKETKAMALQATKLIIQNLLLAYENGDNMQARWQMQKASYYAGIAFTRAYVGYVHAVAHSLGAYYNTAHGLANAVILPIVLKAYGESVIVPLSELAIECGIGSLKQTKQENAANLINRIIELNQKMGIPNTIEDLHKEDILVLAEHALKEANPLYPVPRIFDSEQLVKIYERLLP